MSGQKNRGQKLVSVYSGIVRTVVGTVLCPKTGDGVLQGRANGRAGLLRYKTETGSGSTRHSLGNIQRPRQTSRVRV